MLFNDALGPNVSSSFSANKSALYRLFLVSSSPNCAYQVFAIPSYSNSCNLDTIGDVSFITTTLPDTDICLSELNVTTAVTVYSNISLLLGTPEGQLNLTQGVSSNPRVFIFSLINTRSSILNLSPSQLPPILFEYVQYLPLGADIVYTMFLTPAV